MSEKRYYKIAAWVKLNGLSEKTTNDFENRLDNAIADVFPDAYDGGAVIDDKTCLRCRAAWAEEASYYCWKCGREEGK